jgi:ribosomal protein S18 acetylase RimI-like enzyme
MTEVVIRPASEVDDALVEAFRRLIPQLSSSSPPPTREHLEAIVSSDSNVMLVALADGVCVGSLTLGFIRIPTGLKAWIEDVVVDGAVRGRGVGERLVTEAIAHARERGAKAVELTSNPTRQAANRLYQRIGFVQRETNVYRFKL